MAQAKQTASNGQGRLVDNEELGTYLMGGNRAPAVNNYRAR
jgi:hypothetical protein